LTTSKPVVALGHRCTCSEQRILEAATSGFWDTPAGILHSIDGLSQDLMFKTVNNAFKMVAQTNDISWMHWVDVEDDRECEKCLKCGNGGSQDHPGYYKVNYFMPKMPQHARCRCQWELIYGEI
jgi:hypothetical protein